VSCCARVRSWPASTRHERAALGIELDDDGSRLVADTPGQEARFRLRLPSAPVGPIAAGPRVGVSGHAGGDAFPWRFSLEGDPTVSPYRAAVSRRRGGA
jgi:DNA-3-methyladenine glycosylase